MRWSTFVHRNSSNSVITTKKKDFDSYWTSRNSEDKVSDEKLNKNIQNRVRKCNDCNSAAKFPSISYQAWPSTDKPWARLYLELKQPTTAIKIKLLHKLFTRFGVANSMVLNNGIEFTSSKF